MTEHGQVLMIVPVEFEPDEGAWFGDELRIAEAAVVGIFAVFEDRPGEERVQLAVVLRHGGELMFLVVAEHQFLHAVAGEIGDEHAMDGGFLHAAGLQAASIDTTDDFQLVRPTGRKADDPLVVFEDEAEARHLA